MPGSQAPRRSLLPTLILPALLLPILPAGCNSPESIDPGGDPPRLGPGPLLDAEPRFSPGTTNTVSWSFPDSAAAGAMEFLAQASTDPLFETDVSESGWITASSFEFTGLAHGQAIDFRVRGRTTGNTMTEWSATATSIQDAVAPVAALAELKAEQTSLLFQLELSAADETSGLLEVELWLAVDGAEPGLFGVFQPGEISFQAAGGGTHEFTPVAVDVAGNRQEPDPALAVATLVPEPIIITDRKGEDFDITSAVLEYRMGKAFWEFGVGRFTIRPIIDPLMIGPGEPGYPRDDNFTEIVAVNFAGDKRAYKIGDLPDREVVDDVVNGTAVAVSY